MPIIIKLQDIDEAIENLHYKNETTLKSRLLRAVRQYYQDDASAESLQLIDAEALVKTVWETGDDRDLLKTKRKNFSSLKSSVNGDLKKLYAEGKNPQGIVIGHNNTFSISDEARDKALAGIMDVFKEKGVDTTSKITDILSALGDVLSSAASNTAAIDAKDEIDRLKQIMGGISDKLGLSLQDIIKRTQAIGESELTGDGATSAEMPGRGEDLSGYIRDGVSMLDKGLHGLTEEVDQASKSLARTGLKESLRQALADIIQALKDAGTDTPGKAGKILTAVEQILADAIDATGEELSGEQATELKQIFHEIREGAEDAAKAAGKADLQLPGAGDQLLAHVASILGDGGGGPGDKISRIMAAVNDMIGEALAGSGLSPGDVAQIQSMMGNITENLEAFAHEALVEEDIIEEIIEEGADEGQEALPESAGFLDDVQKSAGAATDEVVEIIEDDFANVPASALPSEEAAPDGAQLQEADTDLFEEVLPGDAEDAIEIAQDLAPQPREDEIIEIIEDVIPEESQTASAEEAQVAAEETAAEMAEVIEDIAAAEGDLSVSDEILEEAPAGTDIVEEIVETGANAFADEIVEVVDEAAGEPQASRDTDADLLVEEVTVEVPENTPEETAAVDESMMESIEEIVEDGGMEASGPDVRPSDKPIDEELREKTDLLSRLAEAAGALEKLGPDLSGSVYTEEEIRGKAKFLSEEFDRYLSIRDKFYNAHILIKGGNYLVGGAHLAKSELEEQIVTLPDFYIGKFPVTNALFEIFIEQTGYATTAERYGYGLVYFPRMQRSRDPITGVERFALHNQAYSKKVPGACWHRPLGPDSSLHLKRTHPVVQVSLEDARAYAAWTGKRLPTEIEWEAAARTAQGLIYPWGNEWQDAACNTEKSLHGDTTPVDHYVKFANPADVADLLGNVLEWTSDVIGDRETSDTYIAKGAGWISHHEISLTDRHYFEKTLSSNILGFRCIAI